MVKRHKVYAPYSQAVWLFACLGTETADSSIQNLGRLYWNLQQNTEMSWQFPLVIKRGDTPGIYTHTECEPYPIISCLHRLLVVKLYQWLVATCHLKIFLFGRVCKSIRPIFLFSGEGSDPHSIWYSGVIMIVHALRIKSIVVVTIPPLTSSHLIEPLI